MPVQGVDVVTARAEDCRTEQLTVCVRSHGDVWTTALCQGKGWQMVTNFIHDDLVSLGRQIIQPDSEKNGMVLGQFWGEITGFKKLQLLSIARNFKNGTKAAAFTAFSSWNRKVTGQQQVAEDRRWAKGTLVT